MSFVGDHLETGTNIGVVGSALPAQAGADAFGRLDMLHARLADGAPERVAPMLEAAHARGVLLAASAGRTEAADSLAAAVYSSEVLVALAAEGVLEVADTRVIAAALARVRDEPLAVATFDLYLRSVSSPVLLELPPVVAAEIQLKLLLHLDIATEASLWRRVGGSQVECLVSIGADTTSRRIRATAKRASTGRGGLTIIGRSSLRSAQVQRFGAPAGAIVITVYGDPRRDVRAYLNEAATALSPLLEREFLLERNTTREQALVAAGEKRLTRLGFDLHDGPIQDILALASETRQLRDEIDPFVSDTHRELAYGRFEDMLARLTALDRDLRELAHSLEAKSIVTRPLSEIIHREAEAFADRSGIAVTVDVRGELESVSSTQKITMFRAVQESLANVREHSGATAVEIRIRARRSSTDVRVTDNGHGFEVARALARAVQRGRLGIVGIGERVRLLGGTFEIDSRPGGPTTLRFSLPRWDPFSAVDEPRIF